MKEEENRKRKYNSKLTINAQNFSHSYRKTNVQNRKREKENCAQKHPEVLLFQDSE